MANKTTSKQISISIELQGTIFYMGNIVSFSFNNSINKKPFGEFIINDTNNDALYEMSGNYGSIVFYNVGDSLSDKNSAISFIVDSMVKISSVNQTTTYQIMWSAGSPESLAKNTWAIKGNSVDALLGIGKKYNIKTTDLMAIENFNKPSDSMVWRYVSDNIWDAYDRTISKSFSNDDYMFWVFDDINNYIKISSFKFEYAREESNLMMFSENARTAVDYVKTILDKPKITVWAYGDNAQFNNLGETRDKLFPNIAFSGINNGEMNKSGCVGPCFDSVLQSNGNTSKDSIIEQTGMNDKNAIYGDLCVIRNYPNNTHKMYSLSSSIRDYYISTYAKHIHLNLYNTLGPEIGSRVSAIMYSNDRKLYGNKIDTQYTDEYIITDKTITLSHLVPTIKGTMVTKNSTEVSVVLKMRSNHLRDEGYIKTKKLYDSIQGV